MNITPAQPFPQPLTTYSEAPPCVKRTKRTVVNTPYRWPDGVVTIALDLGDEKSRALIVDAIREWARHTPALRFNLVEGKKGDIRISDDEALKGNWSVVGTHAKAVAEDQPTMHLDRSDDSKAFRSTALHEFGHALGLLHEHQHPENTLDWDKQAVYDEYSSPDVSDQLIQEQYFKVFSANTVQVTPYDKKSVMHYHIPAHLLNDGQEIPKNTHLSKGDQDAIRNLYTPTSWSVGIPTPRT